MNDSLVWPYDCSKNIKPPIRLHPSHMVCFLICPFKPKDFYNELYGLISDIFKDINKKFLCEVELKRADIISSAGIIHSEIWNEIRTADFLIVDVSGLNGNVMVELGVAAAWREKEQVIIIKNKDTEDFIFDLAPKRHLLYSLSTIFKRDKRFIQDLSIAIVNAMAPAPFRIDFKEKKISDVLEVDFSKGQDVDWLISPQNMNRRLTDEYLEFGSLYSYFNSWLMLARDIPKVEITAIMKFTKVREKKGALIAVSVRKPNVFAEYGHTLFLNTDGKKINRTVPENEFGRYHDEEIKPYPGFKIDKYYKFYIKIDNKYFHMFIDDIGKKYKISEMPFLFAGGKILFQVFRAYAGIKYLKIVKI